MTEPSGLLVIEPLNKSQHRDGFYCGSEPLDHYLKKQAGQDVRRRISQVFIARESSSTEVIGFYTLSALSIEASSLEDELAHKLPKYPLPAALIGRLAVDQHHQGQGIGKALMVDALSRMVKASRLVAIHAAIVDAKDERAAEYYEAFGFQRFKGMPLRLYLPLATVEHLMSDN